MYTKVKVNTANNLLFPYIKVNVKILTDRQTDRQTDRRTSLHNPELLTQSAIKMSVKKLLIIYE